VISRREFGRIAFAGVALPALSGRRASASPVGGVHLGVQTYSFREMARPGSDAAVDVIIESMKACGLDECELWSPQIEAPRPAGAASLERTAAREALRAWRVSTSSDYFAGIRRRFQVAGLTIYAYNLSFNDTFSDEEITRGFDAAQALGAEVITASTTVTVARRLVPFAEKHALPVAMHNHSNLTDPNEFATPASFEAALAMSPLFKVNLDIGHFTAANFDAIAFLETHQARVTNLHLKDRKRDQGANTPWGTGDAPIADTLRWLKRRSSPIRAYVEYEYPGTRGVVAEVTACGDYARKVLTS
jgi:sugar phosphate isomerase/epimerase